MAICKSCGMERAGLMSDMCGKCVDAPNTSVASAAVAPTSTVAPEEVLSEGEYTSMIGQAIIWLSLAGAAICIFMFGKIEVAEGLYSTKTIWSSSLITAYAVAGVNGAFFGFLLSKVGSVLVRLDQLKKKD